MARRKPAEGKDGEKASRSADIDYHEETPDEAAEPAFDDRDLEPSEEDLALLEQEGEPEEEPEEPEEEPEGEPEDIEAMRAKIARLERRAKRVRHLERERDGLRRTIDGLRSRERVRRTEGDERREKTKPEDIPLEVEYDENGKPKVPAATIQKIRDAISAEQEAREPTRDELVDDHIRARAEMYDRMRGDAIDDADDPDDTEDAIEYLEGAYEFLNNELQREIRARGMAVPRSLDELLDTFERSGIAEEFREKYEDVDMEELLEAPSSPRKFKRALRNYMKEHPSGDSRRERGDGREGRRQRRVRERPRDRDRDLRPGGRRTAPRSMARRGGSVREAAGDRGRPGMERLLRMDIDDFLDLDEDAIKQMERLAGIRTPRRMRAR